MLSQTEAATGGFLQEKMFLNISQNSQENLYQSLFFNKVAGHGCFPVSFVIVLRTPFLQNAYGWLLLRR